MSQECIHVDAGNFYCQVPSAYVGEVVMCAGFRFVETSQQEVELQLLSEADVERLTGPEAD